MKAQWKLNPAHIIEDTVFKRILDVCPKGSAIRVALAIAGNMGWRVGEIVHIKIEHINWSRSTVQKGLLKRKRGKLPQVDKPINRVVMKDLRRYVGKRTSGWLFSGSGKVCDVFPLMIRTYKKNEDGVFEVSGTKPNPKKCEGGHIAKRTMQNWFDGACIKAKLDKVKGRGMHALRMCFGIRFAEKKRDPWKLRDQLDHTDIAVSSEYVQTVNQAQDLDDVGGVE